MVTRQEDISFQSTPSAWRETVREMFFRGYVKTFQSTPSAWRETGGGLPQSAFWKFQSTPSAWRETTNFCKFIIAFFISIHSLRMEGDNGWLLGYDDSAEISIHSLRMEGDGISTLVKQAFTISIHSLRMEGDPGISFILFTILSFQSTPSAWRETLPQW